MGDQIVTSSASRRMPSCPCCAFLPEAMFLPTKLLQTDQATSDSVDPSSEVDPIEALRVIAEASQQESIAGKPQVLLVDTHGHAHLDRERHESYVSQDAIEVPTVSLSCAVEEADWTAALEYASQSDSILPGLGVHPWYLADLSDDWLEHLQVLLQKHPSAIVGEIGLCKMARWVRSFPEGKQAALSIQRRVFMDQMRLASRLQRPVTVHCVKQHGVFMSVLKELLEEGDSFPPAIGMHSFTGTAHHVKEILDFERAHIGTRQVFYFGFSHIVNYEMCTSVKSKRQGREAVRAVPESRLLAESDVHCAADVPAGTAGSVAYIAHCLDRPLVDVAQLTARNGLTFLNTVLSTREADGMSD